MGFRFDVGEIRSIFFTAVLLISATPAAALPDARQFPEPQFARPAWQSLNGPWRFAWDDQNVGLAQNWQSGRVRFPKTIQVPFPPESQLSGVNERGDHPISWYSREFEAAPSWRGRNLLLKIGASHYLTRVWVNGVLMGEHRGGQTPFNFDVTRALRPRGPNSIVLRVEHPPSDLFIARGKQHYQAKPEGIFYTRTSGVWQSVWLEAVGAAAAPNWIESLRFEVALDGSGRMEARLRRADPSLRVVADIEPPGAAARAESLTVSASTAKAAPGATNDLSIAKAPFRLARPRLWSPSNPQLYSVRLRLVSPRGAVLDEVSSYFGVREIAVVGGRVLLNRQPLYLKLILDQGYWPQSILAPPSLDALEADVRATLAMGFNGVRKHQKLEDPRFLYLADRMGLLVSSEFASPIHYSRASWTQFAAEWREAIERDRNHPSIIVWVPANESWGFQDLLGDVEQRDALAELFRYTRRLDPTRLVIDNDGWEHGSDTDLFALHDYARTGEDLKRNFATFNPRSWPVIDIPKARPPMHPGARYNGSPLYLSEFAGIGYIMPGDDPPSDAWGYEGLETDPRQAWDRLAGLFAALKQMPSVIGFCLTQLTDVEQEVNGLLTYDRKPKFSTEEIAKLNALLAQ